MCYSTGGFDCHGVYRPCVTSTGGFDCHGVYRPCVILRVGLTVMGCTGHVLFYGWV